jgi:4-amino-4-deoxy-L-arabinose transferase-like glycosyltransferase
MHTFIRNYRVPIILFLLTLTTYLSIPYTLRDFDDYCYLTGAVNILKDFHYSLNPGTLRYPMGFSLLIVPFLLLFGIGVQSAVYPCAILGALSVVLLYKFTQELFNKKAALFAALFMAFSAFWGMSNLIMSDVPAFFFMLLSIYLIVKYIRTDKAVYAYLFYFSMGWACLIRYSSVLVFLIIGIYIFLTQKFSILKRKEIWLGIPIFVLILLPQLIFNLNSFNSLASTGYSGEGQPVITQFSFSSPAFKYLSQALAYIKSCFTGFGTPVFPFFLFGAALSFWAWIKKKGSKEFLLLLAWIVIPLLIMPRYVDQRLRYIILVFPVVFVLSGLGFSQILKIPLLKSKKKNTIAAVLIIGVLIIPTFLFRYESIKLREFRSKGHKAAFLWIQQNSTSDSAIISEFNYAYQYYSQRKVFSLQTSEAEMGALISKFDKLYLVLRESWTFNVNDWMKGSHSLKLLKSFEFQNTPSPLSHIYSRIKGNTKRLKEKNTDRWYIYSIDPAAAPLSFSEASESSI